MFDLFQDGLLGVLFQPMMGFINGLSFGGSKKSSSSPSPSPQALMWPGESELRDQVLAYTKKYGDANANLGKLTPQEQESLRFLGEYGAVPAGSYGPFKMAEGEIYGTLGAGYDPAESIYYGPLIKAIEQRKQRAIDQTRQSYNLGGNLSSLARARAEGDVQTSYEGEIANLMLGLQERERARKLDVLPQALQYGQYVEEGPLRKAEAFRTTGGIPRDLETNAVNLAQGTLTGYRPTYYFPNFSSSPTSRRGFNWGGAASGAAQGAIYGGPYGAVIGGTAGGLSGWFG